MKKQYLSYNPILPVRLIWNLVDNFLIITLYICFLSILSPSKIFNIVIVNESKYDLMIHLFIFSIVSFVLFKNIWKYSNSKCLFLNQKVKYLVLFLILNIIFPFQLYLIFLNSKGLINYTMNMVFLMQKTDWILNLKLLNILFVSLILKNSRFSFSKEIDIDFGISKNCIHSIQINLEKIKSLKIGNDKLEEKIKLIKKQIEASNNSFADEMNKIVGKLKNTREKGDLLRLLNIVNDVNSYISNDLRKSNLESVQGVISNNNERYNSTYNKKLSKYINLILKTNL